MCAAGWNIAVLPADVNLNQARYARQGNRFRPAFRYVRSVGENAWQKIEAERKRVADDIMDQTS